MLIVIVLMFFLGGFGLMMRRNPVDPRAAMAFVGPLIMGYVFLMILFVGVAMALFRGYGELGAAGHLRQGSDVFASDRSRRAAAVVWTRLRTILCEDRQRT